MGTISFEKDSVVLTEKTALNLGVEPGDSIWVENPDGERVEMTLTGVTENYMFTRLYGRVPLMPTIQSAFERLSAAS